MYLLQKLPALHFTKSWLSTRKYQPHSQLTDELEKLTKKIELTLYAVFESSNFSYLMWFFSPPALGDFNLKSTS